MDTPGAVTFIARSEARRFRTVRSVDDLDEMDSALLGDRKLPAFLVSGCHRLNAQPLHRHTSDVVQDSRLDLVCEYLNSRVLPMISPGAVSSVRGYYRIELCDSYSMMPDRACYDNVLSFGRGLDAAERGVALFPDPHQLGNYDGGRLIGTASSDRTRWQDKDPVLYFAGPATGYRDPAMNSRLSACLWGASESHLTRMFLTDASRISHSVHPSTLSVVLRDPVPLSDHFMYRYCANIVGDTACWSRLPMLLSSGSLAVHVHHSDATWYYPLLREGRHFVGARSVAPSDLRRAVSFCRSYDGQCRQMVREANCLARELFGSTSLTNSYVCELLEESGHLHAA